MALYEQKKDRRDESKTGFEEKNNRYRQEDRYAGYEECIDRAKGARNSQKNDTNPYIEKEGFLGMDDLDKMRRNKIR